MSAAAEGARPVEGSLFGIERVKDTTWLDRWHGYFFDHSRGIGAGIFARVEDQRGFLEVFGAADHGTVTGLGAADGRIEAELDEAWAGPVAAWGLGTVLAGFAEALAFDRLARGGAGAAPGDRRAPARLLARARARGGAGMGAFPFVPPPVSGTPDCDYATSGSLSIWSRRNWAGERCRCRSISQCSL